MALPVTPHKGTCHKALSCHTLTLSPFLQAAAGLLPVPSASSVHNRGTTFSSTKNSPLLSNSPMVKQFGQNVVQGLVLSPWTIRPSVSTGTSKVPMVPPNALPSTKTTASTYAPSVAVRATTPSLGHATPKLLEDFLSVSPPPHLVYTDFLCLVFPCLPLSLSTAHHTSIFKCIPHPYNPDAFESFLLKHGLSSHYPLLPFNLWYGFPLGHMPALTNGVVLPNNPSTHSYMSNVQDYLQKELCAGRMSGPFSCEETELILHSPFQSSPLIVLLQTQQCGMPDKVRICRHLSKASKLHASVNSHIHK